MIDKILQAADKLSELYGNEEWVASEREPTIKILQELVEGVQNQTNNTQIIQCGNCKWYIKICAHHHTPSQNKVSCRDFGCRTA